MSNSYSGGTKKMVYPQVKTEEDVINLLTEFIQKEFIQPSLTTQKLENEDGRLIFEADEDEEESPATLTKDGELIYYGAFISKADHPVQTIWENQFEIRKLKSNKFHVRVSSWFGTTVKTWNRKVEQKSMY